MKNLQTIERPYSESLFKLVEEKNLPAIKSLLSALKKTLSEEEIQKFINSKDEEGNTALHLATDRGNLVIINELLATKKIAIDAVNICGETALHRAVYYRDIDAIEQGLSGVEKLVDGVKLLLDAGIDPNIQNRHKYTALHIAAHEGLEEAVNRLTTNKKTNLNIPDNTGMNPLSIAMSRSAMPQSPENFIRIVENLIKNGADVNQKAKFGFGKNSDSQSPLKYAADKANDELVGILLKSGKCSLESINDIKEYEPKDDEIKKLLLDYKLLALANQKDADQKETQDLIRKGATENISKKVKTGAKKKKAAIDKATEQEPTPDKSRADILIDVIVAASEIRNPIIRLFSSHSTNTKSAKAVIEVIEKNEVLVSDIRKIINQNNEVNSKEFKKELEKYIKDKTKSRNR
jgi:hypothetical protein